MTGARTSRNREPLQLRRPEAVNFADKRGKKLNTTVTIHPKLLAGYPGDIGLWVCDLTNKIRIWCGRKKFGNFAIWVRENYVGDRRDRSGQEIAPH